MPFLKKEMKKIRDYLYDHPRLRTLVEYLIILVMSSLSALIFAFSYKAFVAPTGLQPIITGGASGTAQVLEKIISLFGVDMTIKIGSSTTLGYIIQSAFYVLLNIPLALISFKKIGKRFTIFTVVNVGLYFVFVNLIPQEFCDIFYKNSYNVELETIGRALFAGICTGLSSGIAVNNQHSAGGVDIISVLVTKKNTNSSMGKVSLLVNACVIVSYTFFTILDEGSYSFIVMILYSIVYFFVSSLVLDRIVRKTKKVQLEIITSNNQMPDILINYFPHSATVIHGQGAYSKQDKLVVYTVVSEKEVKRAMRIIKEIDPNSFVIATAVYALTGRFYIEPNK